MSATFSRLFLVISLISPSFGHKISPCVNIETTTRKFSLYDAINVLPSRLQLEETVSVHTKFQCPLRCQQRPWCYYFAVCSATSPTTCYLFKESATPTVTPASTCIIFKENSLAACNNVDTSKLQTTPRPPSSLEPYSNSSWPSTSGICADRTSMCADGSLGSDDCDAYFHDCSRTAMDLCNRGVYTIEVNDDQLVRVRCDMGMTVIQSRSRSCPNGFFNRTWSEYESGFGDLSGSCFWLGNAKIRAITARTDFHYNLHIQVKSVLSRDSQVRWHTCRGKLTFDGQSRFLQTVTNLTSSYKAVYRAWCQTAWYTRFKLGSAGTQYRLDYGAFAEYNPIYNLVNRDSKADGFGAPGFASSYALDERSFYTSDQDSENACAARSGNGWWFNDDCAVGNLNHEDGPIWLTDSGEVKTYDGSEMRIIPDGYTGVVRFPV